MINPEREMTFGQMSSQETTPSPDSFQAPNPAIPLGRERLFYFYQDFLKFGRLLKAFLTPPVPTLNDLIGEAGVTTREGVRQLLTLAISKAWETLPPTLQNQYLLAKLTHLGYSAESKARISQAQKGRVHSAETRARMSQAHKGRVSPMKGHEHSAETKARISQAQKGRVHSAETKARMRLAQRQRRRREKQAPGT